jgi:serpin B
VPSRDATEAKPATLVDGNSAFAFDLYQVLRDAAGNLFYSPYSISLALAMTYTGARGETAEQMADTLHFVLPQDTLHQAFSDLVLELDRRGEGARGKDGEGFRLNIINAIWGQKGFQFLPEFLDLLAENYGAGLRLLDFVNAPEKSRIIINDWVSEQTEDRIEDLIPPDVIDSLTRLILTNAIYFNAAWQHPFLEFATKNGIFHLLDGGGVLVPMMRKTGFLGYVAGEGYQAVELLYDGGELSMVILLPSPGSFEAFEELLSAQKAGAIIERLNRRQVALTMPRFEFRSRFSLSDTLMAMGMPAAFLAEKADFSGMTGNRDLFIHDVIHKAFVAVDEAGTEAAAATAVVIGPAGAEGAEVEVNVDRPFVFLIRDIETGTILFVGRVLNPNA